MLIKVRECLLACTPEPRNASALKHCQHTRFRGARAMFSLTNDVYATTHPVKIRTVHSLITRYLKRFDVFSLCVV